MTLQEWAAGAKDDIHEKGLVDGGKAGIYELYLGMWRRLGQRYNYGRYIYDYDWDLMIILDACRADLMVEVADEYDWVTTDWGYSSASSSGEWYEKNFTKEYSEEKSNTALVSANLYTEDRVAANNFQLLDRVWEHSFNEDEGTILAEDVVNSTVKAYREERPDRLIAHFMQPHYPFVPSDTEYGGGIAKHYSYTPWDTVWDSLQRGDVTKNELWPEYRENLRYVLDNVEVLLENVDAEKVIVTADHGNLLGEFGLYAHPGFVPIPTLKRVPWIETTAEDVGDYDVTESVGDETPTDEKLHALGYK